MKKHIYLVTLLALVSSHVLAKNDSLGQAAAGGAPLYSTTTTTSAPTVTVGGVSTTAGAAVTGTAAVLSSPILSSTTTTTMATAATVIGIAISRSDKPEENRKEFISAMKEMVKGKKTGIGRLKMVLKRTFKR